MCSSGIPELSSLEDLRYLKDALSLDDTEEVCFLYLYGHHVICDYGGRTVGRGTLGRE